MNLTQEEIQSLNFAAVGRNVRIHQSVEIYGHENIRIGDNARIDCFSLLSAGSAGIEIGRNVHVAAGSFLFGGGGKIELADFCGLSSRVAIYTASDDYTDGFMTNPTVPERFRKVSCGDVVVSRHVIIGAGSIVLPGVHIKTGAAIGALTCVRNDVEEFEIVAGRGALTKVIGHRDRQLLDLEQQFLADNTNSQPPVPE